ncbi:hypothetical protein [Holdemania massiliensis]|uniref:hypothetical protein n=1 Tax=Holdemania massiliensis TaxID=1468449 RepID=UPI001F0684CF|nr:hypothetical protein [Holdemania massiliensis]MCH1942379.1 hypothetical protein [Holdemania massiliensis]
MNDIVLNSNFEQVSQKPIDSRLMSDESASKVLHSVSSNNSALIQQKLYLCNGSYKHVKTEIRLENLPSILVNYRLSKGYNLKFVSNRTDISEKILCDIESGNLDYPIDIFCNLFLFYDKDFFVKFTFVK